VKQIGEFLRTHISIELAHQYIRKRVKKSGCDIFSLFKEIDRENKEAVGIYELE